MTLDRGESVREIAAPQASALVPTWVARETPRAHDVEPSMPRLLVLLPLLCLVATLVAGVALAQKSILRHWALEALPMQRLQPLHTLLAIGFVLSGISALLWLAVERLERKPPNGIGAALTPSIAVFLAAAVASVVVGRGSGREYLSWSPAITPLLFVVFGLFLSFFFRRFRRFASSSPEAAWLIGVGLICMPLGVLEGHSYLLGRVPLAKDLSFQWHALDIFFAGWNATLYGFGVLVAGGRPTPLRARWLFLLAAFTFVSTFGHHHYASAQPQILKLIAVTASMLAGISFVRHARTLWRESDPISESATRPFLRAAERWTLLAIGSGIFLAIPPVNLVLHGTYAIVAHSMMAMLGVNVMLVCGGFAEYLEVAGERAVALARAVRWTNRLLLLIWIDLAAAGAVEGWLRLDRSYGVVKAAAANLLVPLPVLGALLLAALGRVVWILLLAARRRSVEPHVALPPGAAPQSPGDVAIWLR